MDNNPFDMIVQSYKENIKDISEIDDLRNATKETDLTGLNILYAYKNKNDEDLTKITNILKQKPSLTEFTADFTGNEFTEEGLLPFLKVFQSYWGLQLLDIDFSKGKTAITDSILTGFANSIIDLKFLKTLRFKARDSPHKITDKSMSIFAQSLKNMQLYELSIEIRGGKNQIRDRGMKALSNVLQEQANLRKMKLLIAEGLCEVTDEGFGALADSFMNLIFLEELNLQFYGGFHQITDLSIQKLAKILRFLISLESLELHFYEGENTIGDAGITELATRICKLFQLKKLKMYIYGGNNGVVKEIHDGAKEQIRNRYGKELEFDYQVSIAEPVKEIPNVEEEMHEKSEIEEEASS